MPVGEKLFPIIPFFLLSGSVVPDDVMGKLIDITISPHPLPSPSK